jgi:hypothetical protein
MLILWARRWRRGVDSGFLRGEGDIDAGLGVDIVDCKSGFVVVKGYANVEELKHGD